MPITHKQYKLLKWVLEDNKNGNNYSKGNYLSDGNIIFIQGLIADFETQQALLANYKLN